MPIFDHRCQEKSCGHVWEQFVHRRDQASPCPKCGSVSVQINAAGDPVAPAEKYGRRLRSAAEIKKRVTGDIRKLNERLLRVSNRLALLLQRHEVAKTPPGKILIALFNKAVNTHRGIQFLKGEGLIEESWILLRVLLESHINLIYFVKGEAKEITRRWLDAAMLDKLKYLKEVNFLEGTSAAVMINRAEWEEKEQEIVARYNKAELHAIRRYGFSGLSVEMRAEAIGVRSMYSNCYRIASRSIHTLDPAETGIVSSIKDEGLIDSLLSSRRDTLESTQNLLTGRLAYLMSQTVDDPRISFELFLLGMGYEKYRDKEEGVSGTSEDDSGNFYVWRE